MDIIKKEPINIGELEFQMVKTVTKSDSTTRYINESYNFNPSLSIKLIKDLYLGLKVDFRKTTATKLSDLYVGKISLF